MKRFGAIIIAMICLFLVTSSAMAVSFGWNSSSTTMSRWSADTTSVGTTWKVSSWTSSNLSPSLVAAVKVYHAPGVYASHTFYYNSKSTASHDYLSAYANGETVYMAGCKHSGSGNVTVSGTFEP